MQEIDVNQTILVVVGIGLKPEEKDRTFAYRLKNIIEESEYFGDHPFRKCIVISDKLFMSDKLLQACPTITIGGPGVNMASAEFVEKLPVYLSMENRYFIQLDKEFKEQNISLWGMSHETTEEALDMLVSNGILNDFLKSIWK
jgi:hypothetical protein